MNYITDKVFWDGHKVNSLEGFLKDILKEWDKKEKLDEEGCCKGCEETICVCDQLRRACLEK